MSFAKQKTDEALELLAVQDMSVDHIFDMFSKNRHLNSSIREKR